LILKQILPTNKIRKCIKVIQENLYVDIIILGLTVLIPASYTGYFVALQRWHREFACNVPLKDDCDAGDFLPDFPPSYSGSR